MKAWIANGELLKGDADAEYAAVIDIDQPTSRTDSGLPERPGRRQTLSAVARRQDRRFIGSCMTNIGHFRAPPARY